MRFYADMNYSNHIFITLSLLLFMTSCDKESQTQKEIAAIEVNLNIDRFDQVFAQAKPEDLLALKSAYPFMFSSRYPDSLWVNRMTDTLQKQLSSEVTKAYGDFTDVQDELIQLFQHLHYYFPETKDPRIITVTSEVDYRNKVIVTDTIALIALDNYLGEDHEFYGGIQKYLRQNFKQDQIIPDMAQEYAKRYAYQPKKKTLLEEMIYYGKLLYVKDRVIPFRQEEERIGYSLQQLAWAQENESEIWRYFVDRELLYSTDAKLPARFINPAPFSKFYLELDAESPGRLGQYIGWQIVRAYMDQTDSDLKRMLVTDAETIFKESKFKPRK
jgi:gliding motility-associated lipoprotein GldB